MEAVMPVILRGSLQQVLIDLVPINVTTIPYDIQQPNQQVLQHTSLQLQGANEGRQQTAVTRTLKHPFET